MPDIRAGAVRPILKWAGGKRQLLPELRPFYPRHFERYFEPFLGSAAVFLDLYNSGLLAGREVRLSDINADIIGCYTSVRESAGEVIAALAELEAGYRAGGAAHYYEVRDGKFNPARRRIMSSVNPAGAYTASLAAMLIFLNRTGFNGLFRVNARGEFNVPAGRYANPKICDEPNLLAWSAALRDPLVSLEVSPFDAALADARRGDFIYLDPPYAPLSGTARFTSYTAGGFDGIQQEQLQRTVIGLAVRGASVVLSNSVAPQIRLLYAGRGAARMAGFRATTVAARRAINSRSASRGPIREYLITNVPRCKLA